MGKLRSFTVTYDDGSKQPNNMAGNITDQEIRDYYIGQSFTNEDSQGIETTRQGVNVDIHPDIVTCPHCGMPQPQGYNICQFTKTCGKPLN